MNSSFRDSENSLPNADVLRLREYAGVLTSVTDVIEAIEEPDITVGALEYSYTFDVDSVEEYAIPPVVTELVGPVHHIDIQLSLATDHLNSDDEVDPHYEVEPTPEVLIDKMTATPAEIYDEPVVAQAANISIHLQGVGSVYVISRSSLEDDHSQTPDTVLKKEGASLRETAVTPLSQADFNRFLLSIVDPHAEHPAGDPSLSKVEFLKPEAFGVLNELFQGVTFANDDYLGHEFRTSPTFFKYYRNYSPQDDQPMTSFHIRFTSNEPGGQTIIARSDLDTKFELSFAVITDPDETNDGPLLRPYIPTLDELHHLKELLATEAVALMSTAPNDHTSLELADTIPRDEDPIDEAATRISDEQDFHAIERQAIRDDFDDIVNGFEDN